MLMVEALHLNRALPQVDASVAVGYAQLQAEIERLYLDALAQGNAQGRMAGLGAEHGEQVHADAVALYREDEARLDHPWQRWEFELRGSGRWTACKAAPEWLPDHCYRRRLPTTPSPAPSSMIGSALDQPGGQTDGEYSPFQGRLRTL